jgi:uncharacterized protein (DUF2141 family)
MSRPRSFSLVGAAVLFACILFALTFGVVALSAPASGPSFAEPRQYPVAEGPDGLVSGDLNGDGKLDLATMGIKSISVLLNRGDGTFRARHDYRRRLGSDLAVGDLNGDGRLDLATTSEVLLNRGAGRFRFSRGIGAGSATSVAIGDLNGDRKLDLATANRRATRKGNVNTVAVLLNSGGGSFRTIRSYRVGAESEAIAIGDVNGDRKLDLVTTKPYANKISVQLNKGGARFGPPRVYRTGASPQELAVGDLNADGRADVVTANLNSVDTGPPRVSVLLAKGHGSFGFKRDYPTGWIYSVTMGDLNGDHRPDLVVGDVWGFPSVLINRRNGRFEAMLQFRVESKLKRESSGGEWAAIGDLNGDDKVDLATSNDDRNTVSVLINTPSCNVQEVRRMTLPAATRMLARVNCSVGEVRRDYSAAFKRGLVMWQKPAGGAVRPNGDKVDLVVSIGRKQ